MSTSTTELHTEITLNSQDYINQINQINQALNSINLNLNNLNNASNGANNSLNNTSTTARSISSVISGGLVVGIAGATAALTAMGAAAVTAFAVFNSEAQRASEVYNKAMQLNVNTNDLQAMHFAVQKVGMESGEIDDILKDINDRMGDMSMNGAGEMVELFEQLGLKTEEFIGKDPITVLTAINKAASALSSQERAFIFEAMGSELDSLKPLLAENAGLLTENMEKAKAFGLVISGADTKAYNDFNNTLMDISGRFDGMRTLVMAGLAEPMKEAAVFVDEWIESLGGAEEVASMVSNALVDGLLFSIDAAAFLAKGLTTVVTVIGAAVDGVTLIARGLLEAGEAFLKYTPAGIAADKLAGGELMKGVLAGQQALDARLSDSKSLTERIEGLAETHVGIDADVSELKRRIERGRQVSNERGRSDDGKFGEDDGAVSRETYRKKELKSESEKLLKEQAELMKYQAKSADTLAASQLKTANEVGDIQTKAAESLMKAGESLGKNGYSITASGHENGSYEEYRATMFKYMPSYFQEDINRGWKPESTPANAKAAQGLWGDDWLNNPSKPQSSESKKDMGTITIQVASKEGIIAAIPFFGQIESIEKFKESVGSALGSIAATGRAAQS